MIQSLREYKQHILNETVNTDITAFLKERDFINPKTKLFLFHGTKITPDKFDLRDDYEGKDGNAWSGDLPEGYLFLTTSIGEASTYGKYVIPFELKQYDHIYFKFDTDNPSQSFDDDFGISLNKPTNFGIWNTFEDSGKNVLIIKGNKKYTVITRIDNVIPRTDLSIEFYSNRK